MASRTPGRVAELGESVPLHSHTAISSLRGVWGSHCLPHRPPGWAPLPLAVVLKPRGALALALVSSEPTGLRIRKEKCQDSHTGVAQGCVCQMGLSDVRKHGKFLGLPANTLHYQAFSQALEVGCPWRWWNHCP